MKKNYSITLKVFAVLLLLLSIFTLVSCKKDDETEKTFRCDVGEMRPAHTFTGSSAAHDW